MLIQNIARRASLDAEGKDHSTVGYHKACLHLLCPTVQVKGYSHTAVVNAGEEMCHTLERRCGAHVT